MTGRHPDNALVGYLRDELSEDERRRVATHLDDCEACRSAVGDFQVLLGRLRDTPLPVTDPLWARYRAELRARLEERRRPALWRRWLRPLPVAVAAATAVVVLALTLGDRTLNGDIKSLDEAAVAGRLDLLDKQDIVERLDLLEDLDVIHDLDQLVGTREG